MRSTSCRISSTSCAFSCSPSSAAMASRISAVLISPSPFMSNCGTRGAGVTLPPRPLPDPGSLWSLPPLRLWSPPRSAFLPSHRSLHACGHPTIIVSPRSLSPPACGHPMLMVPSWPLPLHACGHHHGHCSPMVGVPSMSLVTSRSSLWSPSSRDHHALHCPHQGLSRVTVPTMLAVPSRPWWP